MESLVHTFYFADIFNNDLFLTLVQVAAYITPFFLIPATFKFGMGVFSNLTGMLNDRSRGFFDRQRKFREGSKEKYRQRAREGKRFAGGNDGNFRGRLNRGIGRGMNAGAILDDGNVFKPGNWGTSTQRGLRTGQASSIERMLKEDADYATWKGNDALNRAASESNNAAELRRNLVNNYGYREGSQQLNDAVAQVENTRRKMSPEAFREMTTVQAVAGGTAFGGAGEVARAIGMVAGEDDSTRARMVAQVRSAAKAAGRVDHSDMGFNDLYNEAGQWAQMSAQGVDVTDQALVDESTDRLTDRVWESTGGASVVHSSVKPESTRQLARAAGRSVQRAVQSGDSRVAVQSIASLAATHDSLASSSPDKARAWADTVMNQDIQIGSLSPEMKQILDPAISAPRLLPDGRPDPSGARRTTVTYHEAIEAMRGNEAFQEMRREYSSQNAKAAGTPVGDGTIPDPRAGR